MWEANLSTSVSANQLCLQLRPKIAAIRGDMAKDEDLLIDIIKAVNGFYNYYSIQKEVSEYVSAV